MKIALRVSTVNFLWKIRWLIPQELEKISIIPMYEQIKINIIQL